MDGPFVKWCIPRGVVGVLRFGLDGGVTFEPRNPYPFLRIIFDKKGTHF